MTVGVAVVGLGVGEQHARAYSDDERCELRWVVDLDEAKARRVAAELGCRAATSFAAALADEQVTCVSLATYDDQHYEQVLAALAAEKHVFAEKPLCQTEPEARALRDAWRQRPHLQLASNLVLRGAALYRWLRAEREAGRLGEVYAVDGDYLYGRVEKITDGWRKDVDDYSVVLGGGVHLVDLLLWLTGERPVSVTALGNGIATRGTDFRYDDFAAATFRFQSRLVGRVTANFGCVHRHQHVVRVFGTEADVRLRRQRRPSLHEPRSRDRAGPARTLRAALVEGRSHPRIRGPDRVRRR